MWEDAFRYVDFTLRVLTENQRRRFPDGAQLVEKMFFDKLAYVEKVSQKAKETMRKREPHLSHKNGLLAACCHRLAQARLLSPHRNQLRFSA